MRVQADSWNIIQRVIRRYPENVRLIERMENSVYKERLEREIYAVEEALKSFDETEKDVIAERFWTYRDINKGYEDMWEQPYSPRQLRRIAHDMVYKTGLLLGEIKPENDGGEA